MKLLLVLRDRGRCAWEADRLDAPTADVVQEDLLSTMNQPLYRRPFAQGRCRVLFGGGVAPGCECLCKQERYLRLAERDRRQL